MLVWPSYPSLAIYSLLRSSHPIRRYTQHFATSVTCHHHSSLPPPSYHHIQTNSNHLPPLPPAPSILPPHTPSKQAHSITHSHPPPLPFFSSPLYAPTKSSCKPAGRMAARTECASITAFAFMAFVSGDGDWDLESWVGEVGG